MKKHLLIASLVLASAIPTMVAQDPGDRAQVTYSTNLSLEWYCVPTGDAANKDLGIARTGIGANGKFYVSIREKGVAVYGPDGQIKMIDKNDTWISINCDDAGNVYFRNDEGGWKAPLACTDGTPMAWYHQDKSMFSVIDTKSDEIVKSNVPLKGINQCRFDLLPHVVGDMTKGFFEIPVITTGGQNTGVDFLFENLETAMGTEDFNAQACLNQFKFPAGATDRSTLALAQLFNDGENIAVLANPTNNITTAAKGWGNNIAVYELTEVEPEVFILMFSEKWLSLPNHNGCSGFNIFKYDGTDYIIYPTGMFGDWPAADGFFVAPLRLVDSPKNKTVEEDPTDWSNQLHEVSDRGAYKYATEFYGAEGTNYRGFNVEPIPGEDGKFRIYLYCPYKVMEVWTLDLSGSTGIEEIVADKEEAKIFGGIGVVVTQSEGPAQVYTLAGQLVAQGKGTIAVPAGVYVVKADNKAAKVIVK
ncbi:MAG: hypothetical protein K2K00_07910 [Muribaculaceae bacterium]|nr:hypothetical protein [Muribaculaceae bacterium]